MLVFVPLFVSLVLSPYPHNDASSRESLTSLMNRYFGHCSLFVKYANSDLKFEVG